VQTPFAGHWERFQGVDCRDRRRTRQETILIRMTFIST